MKICFVANHKHWGGLANNGGSKTVIRSAETLKELGHKVKILTNSNKYTWHEPKVKIVKKIKHPDRYDVAVAVSVSEIGNVLDFPKKVRKVWWCRGLELWRMPEKKIQKKSKKIEVLVNSSWLLQKFPHGRVAYAGLDFDLFYPVSHVRFKDVHIGALHHKVHKTKRWDLVKELSKNLDVNKCMFEVLTADKTGTGVNYMTYWYQPPIEEMRMMYSTCQIWFAPTELEGFHNVPAEANLCGCLVVCNRLDSNGMGDYATEDTAMRYTGYDELLSAIENPDFSKVAKMQKLLREKIGSREKCMRKFVKILEGC